MMDLATINPTTGELVRIFSELTLEELNAKLERAVETFRTYRRTTFTERAALFLRLADLFEGQQDRLGRLMALEMGKPLAQGKAEAVKCADGCRYYAEHAEKMLADTEVPTSEGRSYIRYEPLGVVLAIMPWNFPFWQVVRFAAPTLMAGNIALLKHANNVPQCGEALDDLFRRAGFAEGCFQYLSIGTERVEKVIEDERVNAVTLTGSLAAGSAVAATAGRNIKKTVLELGGSDPFIVMPSAALDLAVENGITSRTQNAGQSCIAAKRFIVHQSIYEKFTDALVAKFSTLRVGDPLESGIEVGPLAHRRGLENLERQVQVAIKSGAKILTGGRRLSGPGFFYEPTVLVELSRKSAVYREEFFGPVALLFKVSDLNEAIEIANDTLFGLGASVWTQDEDEVRRAIVGLEVGQVFINEMVVSRPELSFGGTKYSGYGRELGSAGLHEFVNAKSVRIAKC